MEDACFEPYLHRPHEMRVSHAIGQQPQQVYRYLRELSLPDIHFFPLVERNKQGQLSAESLTGDVWGRFLRAVFDIWVREDIGRVSVSLFDATLNVWQGTPRCDIAPESVCAACYCCEQRRFCSGCGIASDSVLCSGYRQFFAYSAPYMRVMRDLIKQHRSPMELMVMLR
ncbi:radical SAM protein [Superficieibacter electus]|nr:radical SAM protein [Superficieibacter electus]